jgi:transcriptional regulator with XRE-family HTH domain
MKALKKKIEFTIEKTDTGFSGYSKLYPVITTGKNFTEMMTEAADAMNLFFEDEDIMVTSNDISFEIDLQQFFQYYRVINAKFLAQRIGINETLLSQYVQGKKKPSHKQTDKILHGIQEIGRELANLNMFTS